MNKTRTKSMGKVKVQLCRLSGSHIFLSNWY